MYLNSNTKHMIELGLLRGNPFELYKDTGILRIYMNTISNVIPDIMVFNPHEILRVNLNNHPL